MDCLNIVLSLLFAWTLLHLFSILSRKSRKLPPGPIPLPFIGSLHLIGDQPHTSLAKLAKTYGPIMCLNLGQITTVVISSPHLAKEVLQKQDLAFSSRFVPNAVHALGHYKYSILWLPVASQWRSLRKIMNSNMFSSNSLDLNQHIRFKKIQELIAYCRKKSETGEAVDVGQIAFRTSLNLLSNTIFSKDLTDPTSDSAKGFRELGLNIAEGLGKPNLVDYFPALGIFDPQGIRRKMAINLGKQLEILGGLIDERVEQRRSEGVVKNDLLDVLLSSSGENPQEIDRAQIDRVCLDLFGAGTDTSSSTLEWAMTELLKNPKTMKKAQEELAEVIGKGKPIQEADLTRLPYLQCILKETLRIHPPAPFLIPRRVEQEVHVCGYTVPKGSQVLVNAWAIAHDSSVWKDPSHFNPERFWDSNLDIRGLDFEVIPFGAGRRVCPGLSLAKRMVPVMLGSLLNSFNWKLDGDIAPEQLDMEEKFGITLQKAQTLRAIPIPLDTCKTNA